MSRHEFKFVFYFAVGRETEAFTRRRFERCNVIVEGSEAIGRWERDHSLPMDPTQARQEVMTTAMAPI